jgi:hypothetical protein
MFNNSTETHDWDKCARRPLARLIQLFTFKHMQWNKNTGHPLARFIQLVHQKCNANWDKKTWGKEKKEKLGLFSK